MGRDCKEGTIVVNSHEPLRFSTACCSADDHCLALSSREEGIVARIGEHSMTL